MEIIDKLFLELETHYEKSLHYALSILGVVAVFAIIILFSNYFLFKTSQAELAPQEDQGIIIAQAIGPANASLHQSQIYSNQIYRIFKRYTETDHIFEIEGANGLNTSILGMVLKPWDARSRTSNQIQPLLQNELNSIAGAKIAAFQLPSLPGGGGGLPIQFVIKTTDNFYKLNDVIQNFIGQAYASHQFMYLDSDLKIDQLQSSVVLNREKAADLGFTMQDIGNLLANALSENYINYYNYYGRSYQVIPQVERHFRANPEDLLNYYIKTPKGDTISLATIASIKKSVVPESINHFQQLNSATISAIAAPGTTMGDALHALQQIATRTLPPGYDIDYAGQSRQYIQEGASLIITFFFALIIIFLSLAALFESFRDPLIVLISVPMSICGAMIFVSLGFGGASLNIYSEVGLITLIGLISKHGILIVQFANDLQLAGKTKREAIEMAARIRLRPILMTTAAMVLGVVPLITATGAGALSRYNIGLVIGTGIGIGTLFTLFVVPAMYLLLADNLNKSNANPTFEY